MSRIQIRRGTAAEWADANPVLAQGEPGYAWDTKVLRVGDATTAWLDLDPVSDPQLLAQAEEARDQVIAGLAVGQEQVDVLVAIKGAPGVAIDEDGNVYFDPDAETSGAATHIVLEDPDGNPYVYGPAGGVSTPETRLVHEANVLALVGDAISDPSSPVLPILAELVAPTPNRHPLTGWHHADGYGAVRDGATNDTAACQAAIDAAVAAGGGVVYFPAGTYSVDTLKVNGSKVTLRGAGRATVLRRRPTSGAASDARLIAVNQPSLSAATAAGQYVEGIVVEDLTLDGNNTEVSTTVQSSLVWGTLQLFQVKRGLVRNVYVLNPREFGINVYGCEGVTVDSCTVDGMLGSYAVNSINVAGDLFSGDPGYPVNQRPSRQIKVRGCRIIRSWVKSGDTASEASIGICVQGSTGVSVTDCEVDLTGEPAARGRIGMGIIFEGGGNGTNGAYQLGRDLIALNNKVRYAKIGIGTLTTAGSGATPNGNLQGWVIADNTVEDCLVGMQVSGRNGVVKGNVVRAGLCLSIGVNRVNVVEENLSVIGNTFRSIDVPTTVTMALVVDKQSAGAYLKGLIIAHNLIDGGEAIATAVTPSAWGGIVLYGDVRTFIIDANTIRNTGRYGIALSANGGDSVNLRSKAGRITNNELDNVVAAAVAPSFPWYFGIVSTGSDNVVCALNRIVGGASMQAATNSANTGKMTVFGNMGAAGAPAVDDSQASLRIGGIITGSRGANAALTSLLAGLAAAQVVRDTTTA